MISFLRRFCSFFLFFFIIIFYYFFSLVFFFFCLIGFFFTLFFCIVLILLWFFSMFVSFLFCFLLMLFFLRLVSFPLHIIRRNTNIFQILSFCWGVFIRPGMTFCNFKSREWENISVLKATKQNICRIKCTAEKVRDKVDSCWCHSSY